MGENDFMKRLLLLVLCSILLISCSSKNSDSIEQDEDVNEENEQVETNGNDENGVEEMMETFAFPTEQLQKGDQNEAVSLLQKGLIEIGYPIEPTGVYDDLTAWAITDFQMQMDHVMVTGVYEENTEKLLNKAIEED